MTDSVCADADRAPPSKPTHANTVAKRVNHHGSVDEGRDSVTVFPNLLYALMFDILVYLFDNYHAPAACPETDVLARRLAAAGFPDHEIDDALSWLSGLAESTRDCMPLAGTATSPRVYAPIEQQCLGTEAMGFLMFLENTGVLSPALREIVIDRALALRESPVALEALRIIVLMVLWSQEADIDNLILDELLDDDEPRRLH